MKEKNEKKMLVWPLDVAEKLSGRPLPDGLCMLL